ncbi:hypothetical protein BDF20DRAFT_889022 [Mycotypha africana]|uniref:uncharacterized protein n=1 Tax=Mycotypha africana TaxID=64632 RepID=UPI002301C5C7|nr:uncharacterized protein BDF20DRAFT_889022 [Mycotypha africana]KAI8970045.1 hypothetical protein BDF20DRAFT_889022 [Mycotypha africana]
MSSLGHVFHSKYIAIAEILRAIITRPIYPNSKPNIYNNLLSLSVKPLFVKNHDLLFAWRHSAYTRPYTIQTISPTSTSVNLLTHSQPSLRKTPKHSPALLPESQFSKRRFTTASITSSLNNQDQNNTPPASPPLVNEVKKKGRYVLVHDSKGNAHWARKNILKKPKRKPSTVAEYNKNIMNITLNHQLNKAIKLFREMQQRHLYPDVQTYTIIINGFARQADMTRAYKWYQKLLNNYRTHHYAPTLKPNVYVYTTLIDGYMRESNVDQAEAMFRVMLQKGISPNITTYNVLMHHSVVQFNTEAALKFWDRLLKAGLRSDVYTFAIMIHGLGNESRVDEAWRLFELMQKEKISLNTVLATTLMNMHTDHKDYQYAIELFYRFFSNNGALKPSESTKTVLLKAVLHSSPLAKVYDYYSQYRESLKQQQRQKQKMKKKAKRQATRQLNDKEGNNAEATAPPPASKVESPSHALFVGASVYTFTTFMRAFIKYRDFRMVSTVYADMLAHNVQPNLVTYSVMMYSFSCLCEPETCYRILEDLRRMCYHQQQQKEEGATAPHPSSLKLNAVHYNIVISAFGKAGKWQNAKYIYDLMKQDGIKPDKYTMEAFRHARNAGFSSLDEEQDSSDESSEFGNDQQKTDLKDDYLNDAVFALEEDDEPHQGDRYTKN